MSESSLQIYMEKLKNKFKKKGNNMTEMDWNYILNCKSVQGLNKIRSLIGFKTEKMGLNMGHLSEIHKEGIIIIHILSIIQINGWSRRRV